MPAVRALSSSLALLLFTPVAAQQFALTQPRAQLPAFAVDGEDIALADLDRDGDLDLLVADSEGTTRPLWNDGHARFTLAAPGTVPPSAGGVVQLTLVDFDGDGDLDLHECGVLADRLLRNDGHRFTDVTAASWPLLSDRSSDSAFGDLDGDGDADALLATSGGPRLLENLSGIFVDVTSGRLPGPSTGCSTSTLADADCDGDLDVLIARWIGGIQLLLNDGHGRFTDVTATHLPASALGATRIACGDVDGDLDPDIILAVSGGELSNRQDQLLLNQGDGHFVDVTAAQLPPEWQATEDLAFGDMDGDGDLDAVAANITVMGPFDPVPNVIYVNDGNGRFQTTDLHERESQDALAVALGDLDGDGDLDAVFSTRTICRSDEFGRTRLFLNDGHGHLSDGAPHRLPMRIEFGGALASGDVDGDGDPDLVITYDSLEAELMLDDGDGTFTRAPDTMFPRLNTRLVNAVDLFDVDGDGDLDVFLTGGREDLLFLGDGTGNFVDVTATHLPFELEEGLAVAHGDLDGDGAPDLIVGGVERLSVLHNTGGRFAEVPSGTFPVISGPLRALAVADFDDDGDLDVICGGDARDVFLRNDGHGNLVDDTHNSLPVVATPLTRAIAAGDLDTDGDLDLVLGDPGPDRLYLNDGSGRFVDASASHLPPTPLETRSLLLGDFDEDGDLDLFVTSRDTTTTQPSRLMANDGLGVFTDLSATRLSTPRALGLSTVACDIDRDGDLDLVVCESLCCASDPYCTFSSTRILVNRHRQLVVPSFPARGATLELALFSQPGYARGVQLALPALSPATTAPPVPLPGLGLFALDPHATIALSWLAVVAAPSTLLVPVPVDRALSGAQLACQALIVDFAAPAWPRLTNAVTTRILN